MAERRALLLACLLAASCGNGGDPIVEGSGAIGTIGTSATTGGITSTSTSSGGGAQGNNSLEGAGAFTPEDAFATGTTTALLTVELTDGYAGCDESGAYQVVRVTVPGFEDGGAATYGTYSIDAGATVELWTGPPAALQEVASAQSGQVTLNDLGASTIGGNFAVELFWPDGGGSGQLSGIFAANRCN